MSIPTTHISTGLHNAVEWSNVERLPVGLTVLDQSVIFVTYIIFLNSNIFNGLVNGYSTPNFSEELSIRCTGCCKKAHTVRK